MKATHRLIDSVWTVEYEVLNEYQVNILKFTREDPEGYKRERELPQCEVLEDEKRNFIGLYVRDKFKPFEWVTKDNCDRKYAVNNVKHIFDYK